MKREISELRMLVQQLRDENLLLKGGKDSRTSSTASSYNLGRSNRISLRASSGRKSGGQPGHSGSTLSMSDTPNETIDHYPCVCEQCGEDLQGVKSTSFSHRQMVDIPPIMPVYTEHRSHIKICPLCHLENRGSFPEDLQAPVQPVYENIRERIVESAVVGADETGCHVNGKKHWFHVWQTAVHTFIVSFAHRGYAVIEKYFADGFPVSVYVSDCWSSQLKVISKAHQLCMAHLLRELTNFEKNLKSRWSTQMKELFLSYVERSNGTLRQTNTHLRRKLLTFAKEMPYFMARIAVIILT